METKSADVRIAAKVEKLVEALTNPTGENRSQRERGVDRIYQLAD